MEELENAKGSEHESIFKMASLECFQNVFFFCHKQSRALFFLRDKGNAQSVLKNFGFDNEYEKVFIIFWTLQTNFCNSAQFFLVARKLLQSVTNEPNELKL